MPKNAITFIFIIVLTIVSLRAQTKITGTVLDQSNHTPLIGASVVGASDSAITDAQGKFEFEMNALPASITVAYLGYQSQVVNINKAGKLNILLSPSETELQQVVVTAGLADAKMINSTASVSLITPAQLQRDDPFSITNSLNRTPGVYMHSGTLSTNRITIRGMGSRSLFATDKIKAYYDQIPLTDGSGNSTIEDLDQRLMERIEVIKGPNSSVYGAGLGGVIRISSTQPEFQSSTVSTGITAGSYGTYRWVNDISHSDDRMSLSLVHSDVHSNGWRENSTYDKAQVGLIGRYYFKNDSYLNLIAIHTDLKAQIPSSINTDDFNNNPKVAASNWADAEGYEDYQKIFAGFSYHYRPGKNLKLSHALNMQTKDSYEAAPRPVNIMAEDAFGFSTRHVLEYSKNKLQLAAGLEWFLDDYRFREFENLYVADSIASVEGEKIGDLTEKRSYLNVFTEATFHVNEKLSLVAGLNINETNYDLTDAFNPDSSNVSGKYGFRPIVSPRFGSVLHLNQNTHLFANISHGFSQPTLQQTLYPDGQINPNIKPETGWNFESGVRGSAGKFSYDVSVYYMKISNLLVDRRVEGDVYIGVNAGENDHFGSEIYIDFTHKFNNQYSLRLFNSASIMHYRFTDFVEMVKGENNTVDTLIYNGNQLTGVPEITLNPGLELLSSTGFYGNINAQYVGKIPITDANDIYSSDYLIVRSKIGYRRSIGRFDINVYAGVNNITDKHYASMLLINPSFHTRYYYPGMPRNYYGGFSLKYRLK